LPRWLATTLDLTDHYGVTFYGGAYHAIALAREGLFVTADERYDSRTSDAGAVVMLRDWVRP
jgi:predicted nucleic acid-binding protein